MTMSPYSSLLSSTFRRYCPLAQFILRNSNLCSKWRNSICVISITFLRMRSRFCLWFLVFVYNKCLSSFFSLGLDDHLQKNSYRAFFIRSKRSWDSEKEYFLARDCLSFVRTPVTKSINGISFNAYRKIVRIAKKMRIWNFFFFKSHSQSLRARPSYLSIYIKWHHETRPQPKFRLKFSLKHFFKMH